MEESNGSAVNASIKEKRSAERKRVHWRALIVMASGEKLPGHILDISEGGARLVSQYSFPTGSVISVGMFVPDRNKAGHFVATMVSGKVAFQVLKGAEVCMGLEFVKPSAAALATIRDAIRYAGQ